MNEDFFNNSRIDAELQVRLMNLVMGEASDFERDQLQAMMEERDELAAYCRHLEHLHGLLCEVGTGEPSLEAGASDFTDAWQLPADRREKLLAVLDGKAEARITPVRLATSVSVKLKPFLTRRWLSGLAVAAASLLLGIVIFPRSRLGKEQLLSQRANAALLGGTTHTLYLADGDEAKAPASQAIAMSGRYSQVELDKQKFLTPAPLSAEQAPTSNYPSSYYLKDNVQYYPQSGPSAAATPTFRQSGLQPATPAIDADTNGTIAVREVDESRGLTRSFEDRFDRGGQVSMPGIGFSTGGDAMPGKPGTGSITSMDGVSSPAGSAGEMPFSGGGGMSGGGMGGSGMGMDGRVHSWGLSFGEGGLGLGGQLGEVNRREFAEGDFTSGGATSLNNQGLGYAGAADIALENLTQPADKSGQVASVEFFDSGVRFGHVAKSESGIAAPNQPTSGNENNLANDLARQSWSVDLPKSDLSEFESLNSSVDGEAKEPGAIATTVPDGGSIMLGGIKKNRSVVDVDRLNDEFGATERPSLMQTDTPRIVIDEEENVGLGEAGRPQVSEPQLQASEQRITFGGDFGTSIVPPQIDVRRGDEVRLSVDGSMPGPVSDPSADLWQDLSDHRQESEEYKNSTRGSGKSSGSGEASQLDLSLLGDVQVEVVDPAGVAIVKGSKGDVQNTLEVIDQIKQQGQQESGKQETGKQESNAEMANLARDAKANISGPESQVNAEWFRKQVGGFQAASGKDNKEQLAELNKGLKLPQDTPVDSFYFSSPSVSLGNARTQAAKETLDTLREKVNDANRAKNSAIADSSNKLAMERALTTENLFSDFIPPQAGGLGRVDKEAPSPEIRRSRGTTAPVTKGSEALGQSAGSKTSSLKTAESKADAKTEEFGVAKDQALAIKPADSKHLGVATAEQRERNLWSERRPSIDEQSAAKEAFSTFSLHVSDVSFKLAQTALGQGQWPEAAKIRIEEFVNALDYRDPLPSGHEKVACRIEQAIHPFLIQRNMLRVSMRTAATGRSQNTPLRLTVLLDNSGSMERPDRRQAVLRAFQTLSAQLKASDQVTLISFASSPRLLADKVPGNQGETLLQLIENLPSEGGTNIEAALMLAREKAAEQQLAGAQNRIVLLTDGAVNLGNANPDSLAKLVTGLRDSGIAFDAAGISAHDLNDEVLEALTRQGDGRYYLLDSAESANESFAAQIAGALRPSAQNVKVQVEFNPQRVGRYKLLGFEKHRLNKEDFRNDKVDAAEMAAAEAGVAVYQFEIKPNGTGDVGSVSVRFRDLTTGNMVENRWPIPFESNAPRLEQAEPSMKLAACAALFAAKLSGGPLGDSVDLAQLRSLLAKLPEQVVSQTRVQQLRAMIDQASAIGR